MKNEAQLTFFSLEFPFPSSGLNIKTTVEMKKRIYLDNHSTTPVDPQVLKAMLPYFSDLFGNASSQLHSFGWEADAAVEKARGQVAKLLSCETKEVFFTSGATESTNIAIQGAFFSHLAQSPNEPFEIVTSEVEHKATLNAVKRCVSFGAKAHYVPVNKQGLIDLNRLEATLTSQTKLVTFIHGQNEIGTLQDIHALSALVRRTPALFHLDVAQSLGRSDLNCSLGLFDMLSFSGHKIYGPKGVGGLYIRRRQPRIRLESIYGGGDHEMGIRPGTLNVPGIVGMGEACQILNNIGNEENARLRALRLYLEQGLLAAFPQGQVNGHHEMRLPHNLSFTFPKKMNDVLAQISSLIAVSTGSACASGSGEPSHVLKAIGHSVDKDHTTIRFGLGRFTTEEDLKLVLQLIASAGVTPPSLENHPRPVVKLDH